MELQEENNTMVKIKQSDLLGNEYYLYFIIIEYDENTGKIILESINDKYSMAGIKYHIFPGNPRIEYL